MSTLAASLVGLSVVLTFGSAFIAWRIVRIVFRPPERAQDIESEKLELPPKRDDHIPSARQIGTVAAIGMAALVWAIATVDKSGD